MPSMPPRSGRGPYTRIAVLKSQSAGRPVLGSFQPLEDDRRARAATQWGTGHTVPRGTPPASREAPLPTRVRTLLSHAVEPELAGQLRGGPAPSPASRRDTERKLQRVLDAGSDGVYHDDPLASPNLSRRSDRGEHGDVVPPIDESTT